MAGQEIHFYPKSKVLIVYDIRGASRVKRYVLEAWGGPARVVGSPTMDAAPTTAGQYVIDKTHAYKTQTWPMSRIKWGARLRDMPSKNDIWYETPGGSWASVQKVVGISRREIQLEHARLYGRPVVPARWVFNDFGPIAVRYFRDLNANRRMDGKERLMGEMIHTTPDSEAAAAQGKPVSLQPSHGCIHISPKDRDVLIKARSFRRGTPFIVHTYAEDAPYVPAP